MMFVRFVEEGAKFKFWAHCCLIPDPRGYVSAINVTLPHE